MRHQPGEQLEGLAFVTFRRIRQGVAHAIGDAPAASASLGAEAPVGWIVTGYPHADIRTPEHTAFADAYRAKYNDYPRLGSVVGYSTMQSIAAAVARAQSTETEKLVDAFSGLKFTSVFGPAEYRAIDHQSTVGAYVGKTALKDGKGVMVDWRYADGARYLPPDDVVKTLRPAG